MKKEEILQRARREQCDEMEVQVRDHSMRWTYITMVLVAAIFSQIRASQQQPMMDLCATVSASVCVGNIYRFVKLKDKGCLVVGIITFAVMIMSIVRYSMGY